MQAAVFMGLTHHSTIPSAFCRAEGNITDGTKNGQSDGTKNGRSLKSYDRRKKSNKRPFWRSEDSLSAAMRGGK